MASFNPATLDMQWLQSAPLNLARMHPFNNVSNYNDLDNNQQYAHDEDGAYAIEGYDRVQEQEAQEPDINSRQDGKQPPQQKLHETYNPMTPGLSQTPPNLPRKAPDPRDLAQRAAALRAKLLSMKSNVGTPKREASPARETPASNAADVDSLIAEGRAAVEARNKVASGVNGYRKNEPQSMDTSSVAQGAEETRAGASHDVNDHSHEECNQIDKQTDASAGNNDVDNQLHSYDEVNNYNPGHSSNAATHSHYFDDLDEWLEITGYHDCAFREKYLHKQRALAELERQRAAIQADFEADFDDVVVPTVLRARAKAPLTVIRTPPRSTQDIAPEQIMGRPSTKINAGSAVNPNKRPVADDNTDDQQPTPKVRRIQAPSNTPQLFEAPRSKGGPNYDTSDNPMPPPPRSQNNRTRAHSLELEPSRPSIRSAYASRTSNQHAYTSTPNRQIDSRTRASVATDDRDRLLRVNQPNPPHYYDDYPPDADRRSLSDRYNRHGPPSVGPRSPPTPIKRGTRYFMIKSWNHENVETSQREGTWATQLQNEELFRDAFLSARNVMLVFSVNKSMAFQGYARMQTVPGTAPEPPWVKKLLWPCSPPFYVRWVTIAETHFRKVGHLKNEFNEGQAVLIGRDGQEIEERCGAALCELIDEQKAMFSRSF